VRRYSVFLGPADAMMKLQHFFRNIVAGVIVLGCQCASADARDYPTRPVTLISPWPPGGANDTLSRLLAVKLSERLGKPIVVENRPGAGSTIGATVAARAAPDGYTLVAAGSVSLASAVTVYKRLPYDPTKDFAPVALTAYAPFLLVVHPSLPVSSVSELVQLAKEKPDQLMYASGGPGSPHHLFTELFKSMTGIQMRHVPYRGSAPAVTDLLGGHVPIMFSDTSTVLPLIRAGKLRALGVSTRERLGSAPDIPSLAEAGVPGFDAVAWGMIVAPAHTPTKIVNRLHAEVTSVVALPEVQQEMFRLGMLPASSPSPDELQGFINSEIERWGKIVRLAGIAGSE
jgi:tripartite-type tricarboxylate transporter receptor subunit TctC